MILVGSSQLRIFCDCDPATSILLVAHGNESDNKNPVGRDKRSQTSAVR